MQEFDCPNLWALLAPLTRNDFQSRYWQRAPLHLRACATGFLPLLSLDDIDSVLHRAAANAGEFDFYSAGSALPQSHWAGLGNYALLNRLLGLYAKGGTIHVSNIQKYAERVGDFCRRVQTELLVDCEADLWMTRHNCFEPYLHFDRYDIFVLQIQGKKRWRLFETLPIAEDRKGAALAWAEVGEPVIDVVVEPGDLIYIPPHTPHVVTTVGEHSVHLGIGLHPLTWRQVFAFALEESKARHHHLDEVVPLEFMRNLGHSPETALSESLRRAGEAVDLLDPNRFATRVMNNFLANLTHAPDRHVATEILGGLAPIDAQTQVRRREGVLGTIEVQGGRVVLRYSGGGEITAPTSHLRAFEMLVGSEGRFSAHDLDGSLALTERVELVARAVDAGFCRRTDRRE